MRIVLVVTVNEKHLKNLKLERIPVKRNYMLFFILQNLNSVNWVMFNTNK